MARYLFTLIIIGFSFYCNAQTYTEFYNLDFQYKKVGLQSWHVSGNSWGRDTSETYCGRYPTSVIKNENENKSLYGFIFQTIWLPDVAFGKASISLTYKCLNIKSAQLTTSVLDNTESILSSDTFSIETTQDWNIVSNNISISKAAAIKICILVNGIDSACKQKFSISEVKIKLDGKDIDTFPVYYSKDMDVPEKDIIPLSFQDSTQYAKINYLKDKKIIAIGESNHGCHEFNECAFQLMKSRIINDGCDLVIMEKTMQALLPVNSFIHGDTAFNIDSVLRFNTNSDFFSLQLLREFILWLRNYNETADKKVSFCGMDVELNYQKGLWSIFDFLYDWNYGYEWNQGKYKSVIDSLCLNIFKDGAVGGLHTVNEVCRYVDANADSIENTLGKIDFAMLRQCLYSMQYVQEMSKKEHRSMDLYRDTIMYNNIMFLEKLLQPSKITVYSHLGHANYIDNSDRRSYGYYMKNRWKDDYGCIGLFSAMGDFLSADYPLYNTGIGRLNIVFPGSLEYLLASNNKEYYFYLLPKKHKHVMSMRHIGNHYTIRQFERISLENRMDAVIYIDKETPSMNESINNKNEQHFERFMDRVNMLLLYKKIDQFNRTQDRSIFSPDSKEQ